MDFNKRDITFDAAIYAADYVLDHSTQTNGMVHQWRRALVGGYATHVMMTKLVAQAQQVRDALQIQARVRAGEPLSTSAAELGLTPSEAEKLIADVL